MQFYCGNCKYTYMGPDRPIWDTIKDHQKQCPARTIPDATGFSLDYEPEIPPTRWGEGAEL